MFRDLMAFVFGLPSPGQFDELIDGLKGDLRMARVDRDQVRDERDEAVNDALKYRERARVANAEIVLLNDRLERANVKIRGGDPAGKSRRPTAQQIQEASWRERAEHFQALYQRERDARLALEREQAS